jgi:hypothetical protein
LPARHREKVSIRKSAIRSFRQSHAIKSNRRGAGVAKRGFDPHPICVGVTREDYLKMVAETEARGIRLGRQFATVGLNAENRRLLREESRGENGQGSDQAEHEE